MTQRNWPLEARVLGADHDAVCQLLDDRAWAAAPRQLDLEVARNSLQVEGTELLAVRKRVRSALSKAGNRRAMLRLLAENAPPPDVRFDLVSDWYRPVVCRLVSRMIGIDLVPSQLAEAADLVSEHFDHELVEASDTGGAAAARRRRARSTSVYRELRKASCRCGDGPLGGVCAPCRVANDSVVFGMASTIHTLLAGWVDRVQQPVDGSSEAAATRSMIEEYRPSLAVDRFQSDQRDGKEPRRLVVPLAGPTPTPWVMPFGHGAHRCPGESLSVRLVDAVGDYLDGANLRLRSAGAAVRVRELISWPVTLVPSLPSIPSRGVSAELAS